MPSAKQCAAALALLAGVAVLICEWRPWPGGARTGPQDPYLKRMRQRVAVHAAAVVLWPAVVLALLGWAPFRTSVSATVSALVLLYLSLEVTGFSIYAGPLEAYENCDTVYERSVQVSAVAFAVSTLLLSQRDDGLAKAVALPVFLALLFCTASAVPSAVARRRVGANGHWNALQKVAVSYAAGLLCLSVGLCLDLLTQEASPLVEPNGREMDGGPSER